MPSLNLSVMINTALTEIKKLLSFKLGKKTNVTVDTLSKDGQESENGVLVTLIHIEEERLAKVQDPYYLDEKNCIKKRNPEIRLNLYVLISTHAQSYDEALKLISKVIGVFQAQNVIEVNTNGVDDLMIDLYPLTFEQNNSLWQTSGAKLMPSVMYKVRLLAVQTVEMPEDVDIIQRGIIAVKNLKVAVGNNTVEEDDNRVNATGINNIGIDEGDDYKNK